MRAVSVAPTSSPPTVKALVTASVPTVVLRPSLSVGSLQDTSCTTEYGDGKVFTSLAAQSLATAASCTLAVGTVGDGLHDTAPDACRGSTDLKLLLPRLGQLWPLGNSCISHPWAAT